nr:MAG TPA: INTRON-ENCODED ENDONUCLEASE I-SCEI [Caudoviricetes sp.]
MNDKWNVICTLQKNKTNYVLHISQKSRKHFEELIFPFMIPSMYYKLKYIQDFL